MENANASTMCKILVTATGVEFAVRHARVSFLHPLFLAIFLGLPV